MAARRFATASAAALALGAAGASEHRTEEAAPKPVDDMASLDRYMPGGRASTYQKYMKQYVPAGERASFEQYMQHASGAEYDKYTREYRRHAGRADFEQYMRSAHAAVYEKYMHGYKQYLDKYDQYMQAPGDFQKYIKGAHGADYEKYAGQFQLAGAGDVMLAATDGAEGETNFTKMRADYKDTGVKEGESYKREFHRTAAQSANLTREYREHYKKEAEDYKRQGANLTGITKANSEYQKKYAPKYADDYADKYMKDAERYARPQNRTAEDAHDSSTPKSAEDCRTQAELNAWYDHQKERFQFIPEPFRTAPMDRIEGEYKMNLARLHAEEATTAEKASADKEAPEAEKKPTVEEKPAGKHEDKEEKKPKEPAGDHKDKREEKNPEATNWYHKVSGVGGFGGKCTCPDGQDYEVGDHNDNCGSMACEGGTPGTCHSENDPSRLGMQVTCAKAPVDAAAMSFSTAVAARTGPLALIGGIAAFVGSVVMVAAGRRRGQDATTSLEAPFLAHDASVTV